MATDIIKRPTAAHRTRWLVGGCALAALFLELALLLLMLLGTGSQRPAAALQVFLILFSLLASCFGFSTWRKARELRSRSALALSLGGTSVNAASAEVLDRRLLTLIEELATAAKIPLPQAFVLRQAAGINAFAAGRSAADATVGVTQGALQALNAEELRALLAYEISQIRSGDMVLNQQLLVSLHGFFAIAALGRRMIATRNKRGRRDSRVLAAAVAVMVIGSPAELIGRLLQAAVSRRRRRLADAGSVELAHSPQALTNVLLKIAGSVDGARIETPAAAGAAHLLFASGEQNWTTKLGGIFATHPSSAARMGALDPAFDVRRIKGMIASQGAAVGTGTRDDVSTALCRLPENALRVRLAGASAEMPNLDTLQLRWPAAAQQEFTRLLSYYRATPQHTFALVIAALLPQQLITRRPALQQLARVCGGKVLPAIVWASNSLRRVPRTGHWAMLLALQPQIDGLTGLQRDQLLTIVRFLSRLSDGSQLLRYCALRLLQHGIKPADTASDAALKLTECTAVAGGLFAILAFASQSDEARARRAYDGGVENLLPPTLRPAYRQPPAQWAQVLDAALEQLRGLHPVARKSLATSLALTATLDGWLAAPAAELLRLVCAVIGVPLPPLPCATESPGELTAAVAPEFTRVSKI